MKNESRTISAEPQAFGTNCADLYASGVREDGVYSIDPDGLGSFQVRCEMSSGSGWTVIQRRLDGSVNFYLGWSQYKSGFGDLNGEFWLGLDKIHRLTKSGLHVLRVDLMDFNNAHAYAQYTTFKISDESSRYTLNVGGFSGELLEFFFERFYEFAPRTIQAHLGGSKFISVTLWSAVSLKMCRRQSFIVRNSMSPQ